MSRRHKEAFSQLTYGIKERMGFLEITGEIGTGKTTLCKALLNQLNGNTKTAYIFNPDLSQTQLLETMLNDFGLEVKNKTKVGLFKQLNNFLLDELKMGNNVVLIIDEAQNLKNSVLEQIRLLSNLETEKEKLFQIILVGQPQLKDKLASPALEQLRQRIAVRYHILPLSKDEVADYVNHRLKIAGSNGDIEFTDDAMEKIYETTGGVPRIINIVCDRSLLFGFVMETNKINSDIILKSFNEIKGVDTYEHNK